MRPASHGLVSGAAMAAAYLLASAVSAQALDAAARSRIDEAVQGVLAEDGAPSASIAVVIDGKLAYASAYGAASLAPEVPATPTTRYQIASISKTFTAEALLLLEADGKLSLDDPVARWIPGLTQGDKVTLRDLLQHISGYPDHYPQTYPAGPRTTATTPDRIIAEWGHHPLLFTPGTQFRYSNLNYVIAGRIAELASGEPLFSFMQKRIFAPLGMVHTINLDETSAATPEVAIGYMRPALAPLRPAPEEGRGWSFGAGQVVTTATDLGRWDEAFLAGKLLPPKQAQSQVTQPMLHDGSRSAYGLGLFISQRGGRTVYYHVGQGLGFLAINRIYPSEHAAIVVLTNDTSSAAFQHIADRLTFLIVPPTPADAEARAVFTELQKNTLDRRHFTASFNAFFDPEMAEIYAGSLGPLGALQSFTLRSEDEADGLTTRRYDAVAGRVRLSVIEQVVPDGRIESYQVARAVE